MLATPAASPVNAPVALTVATPEVPTDHDPPVAVGTRLIVEPIQTDVGPDMAGVVRTDTM